MVFSLKIFALICLLPIMACGTNVFQAGEEEDPLEDALLELEKGHSSTAIRILEKALVDEPENYQMISVLSMAYAQRAGLDPIDYALGLADKESEDESENATLAAQSGSTGSGSNPLIGMFDLMPEASTQNISDVQKALDLLVTIPSDAMVKADIIKLALFQVALLTLQLKALDVNGDGDLSVVELLQLSTLGAKALLTQLSAAKALLAANGDGEGNISAVADQLGDLDADIAASPGANETEKLKNYLVSKSKQQ
jgi:uncharacterized membrane protein (DUF2068 family)